MNEEIEQAIEAHDAKKRKRNLIIVGVIVGLLGLAMLMLYGCACYMSTTGQCS